MFSGAADAGRSEGDGCSYAANRTLLFGSLSATAVGAAVAGLDAAVCWLRPVAQPPIMAAPTSDNTASQHALERRMDPSGAELNCSGFYIGNESNWF